MAFFDEIGKKISQTGQGVVQKTKDTAEIMKLNNMISDEEKRINSYYTEIGKKYFETHAESCEDVFADLVAGVKDAHQKIIDYSEQVKKLRGVTKCPNCGGDIAINAQFCSLCGFRMATATVVQAEKFCTNCGASVKATASFCTHCGTKLIPPTPPVNPVVEQAPVEQEVAEPEVAPTVEQEVVEPVVETIPEVQPIVKAKKFCTNCGAALNEGASFCTNCGKKIVNNQAEAPKSEFQTSQEAQPIVNTIPEPVQIVPEIPNVEESVEAKEPNFAEFQPSEFSETKSADEANFGRPENNEEQSSQTFAPSSRVCSNCGKVVSETAKFCTNCGSIIN